MTKNNPSKRNHASSIISVIAVVALVVFFPDLMQSDQSSMTIDTTEYEQLAKEFDGTNMEILPKLTLLPIEIDRVVDGDTIDAKLFGERIKIRYLMINAPEIDHSDVHSSEPYALEARDMNQSLLNKANQVYLELDVGPVTDHYGRVLGYVYSDETLILEELVSQGLATVRYINPPNNSYEQLLRRSEEQAKQAELNIWK
ncbi:thermonuclease family protein [Aerococcaceae bacterium DSM 111020]|nr:thermonuclease family protein [Aerococcaceae bacterium DSM 111020]